jgi:hypothetical protein
MIAKSELNGLGLCHRKTEGRRQRIDRLPARCIRALDADGVHRGKTWRGVPGHNIVLKACNWYLFRNDLITFREFRSNYSTAPQAEEGGEP